MQMVFDIGIIFCFPEIRKFVAEVKNRLEGHVKDIAVTISGSTHKF